MTPIEKLSTFLRQTTSQENEKPIETLAGYIVGELIGDDRNEYISLLEENTDVMRISDLASDLEWSNGSPVELARMWDELKMLVDRLPR